MCECGAEPANCQQALCPHEMYVTVASLNLTMKYTVTVKKTATAIVEYEDGILSNLQMPMGVTAEQAWWLKTSIPERESELKAWAAQSQILQVDEVPQDLTFNAFWEAYNYKVGKKDRAIKYWNALTESDKAKVFQAIPKYNFWLAQRPNMERLYPEGFLHQRRFENEFKRN